MSPVAVLVRMNRSFAELYPAETPAQTRAGPGGVECDAAERAGDGERGARTGGALPLKQLQRGGEASDSTRSAVQPVNMRKSLN
jgi:hypothetical protein